MPRNQSKPQSGRQLRLWLVRWLYAAALGHFLAGVLIPLLNGSGMVEIYLQMADRHFWPQAAPDAARQMEAWWMSLFGPTIQTVGLWMAALIYLGDQHRSRFAWLSLMAGILIWAPQDMWLSLQADMAINAWIDCVTLAILIPPLFYLWKTDAPLTKDKA